MSDAHRRVRRIFMRALDLAEADRADYLDRVCREPEVRHEVESLLAQLASEPDFLERRAVPLHLPPPAPGDNLGDFQILREIGRGGMGFVFEAWEQGLQRVVALKVMREDVATSRDAVERFRREAEITARLRHRNIVQVHRLGEDSGRLYIVSERMNGPPLDVLLQERAERGERPLPEKDVAAIVGAVAEALDYAHHHGVVHRDVKPSNVLMDEEGSPRLTDFGQAKDLLAGDLTASIDRTGTYHYMSPEQANASSSSLDRRTDVFSLGVVLYEMLTGTLPFRGETVKQVLDAITEVSPPGVRKLRRELSKDMEIVCAKALEKDPRHRYQSAGQLAGDLRAVVEGDPIVAHAPAPWRRFNRFVARHRALVAATVAILIAVPAAVRIYQVTTDVRPRLTIHTDPSGAELFAVPVRPSDESLGVPTRIGRSPRSRRVDAGYYRIVAKSDGYGFAEATRLLVDSTSVDLELRLLPTPDVVQSMVRIAMDDPTIVERVRAAYQRPPPASFWIDRTEVSNADFRRFLEESGSDYWPPLWPEPTSWDESWDPLPVAGIPFEQAQAYAEWNGKRLPTRAEWELAARGPDAWLYPWGADPQLQGEVVRKYANAFGDDPRVWSLPKTFPSLRSVYTAAVLPVTYMPPGFRDSSWVGLYHVLGNVAEWTESVPADSLPAYQLRIITGDHWARDIREHYNLSSHMTGSAKEGALLGFGFRCAKSDFSGADAKPAASPRLGRR